MRNRDEKMSGESSLSPTHRQQGVHQVWREASWNVLQHRSLFGVEDVFLLFVPVSERKRFE